MKGGTDEKAKSQRQHQDHWIQARVPESIDFDFYGLSPLQKALSPGGRGLGEGEEFLEWTYGFNY
jgi:hypothetical protein